MYHRRMWFFLTILILAICPSNAQEITCVTINIWSGLDYEGILKMGEYESRKVRETRYDALLDGLKTIDPDVIAINEANPLPAYVRRLARDLGYNYIYNVGMSGIKLGKVGIPINFKEGDAILARKNLQLQKFDTERLSPGSGCIGNFLSLHFAESNQAIAGVIQVDGKSVYIVNTHLHAGLSEEERWLKEMGLIRDSGAITDPEYQELVATWRQSYTRRKEEVEKLLMWLEQGFPPDAPTILMGDFNAIPTSEEIRWIGEHGFLDSYPHILGPDDPGFTWDPRTNSNIQAHYHLPEPDVPIPWFQKLNAENEQIPRRIDYIFVKNVPQDYILDCNLIFDEARAGLHPSDHFGVLARIRIVPD